MSTDGFGNAVREPSGAWLNCMNTRFQNSMKRSPCGSCSGPPSGPNAGPRSMWISEHGPHGPVSPICQKLSLSPSRWIRSQRHADLLVPDLLGLVVALVDGDPEPVAVEAPATARRIGGDEVPAPRDDLALEVVAEAEVAEHLEEHEVTLGAPDVVEIVVLAAGAGALLRADGARVRRHLVADEVGLERHHAGDREHHRRVVRDQARRRHDDVVLLGEVVEEGLP